MTNWLKRKQRQQSARVVFLALRDNYITWGSGFLSPYTSDITVPQDYNRDTIYWKNKTKQASLIPHRLQLNVIQTGPAALSSEAMLWKRKTNYWIIKLIQNMSNTCLGVIFDIFVKSKRSYTSFTVTLSPQVLLCSKQGQVKNVENIKYKLVWTSKGLQQGVVERGVNTKTTWTHEPANTKSSNNT